jgi:hypothetical protein
VGAPDNIGDNDGEDTLRAFEEEETAGRERSAGWGLIEGSEVRDENFLEPLSRLLLCGVVKIDPLNLESLEDRSYLRHIV